MARHRKSTDRNSNETSVASRIPERTLRRSACLQYTEAQTKNPAKAAIPAKPANSANSAKATKRRPAEILDTSRLLRIAAKKARKAGSQGVAPSCPLLELPAEIRNYIWELVLGGEALHVWGYHHSERDLYDLETADPHRRDARGVSSCRQWLCSEHPEQQAKSFKATEECDGRAGFIDAHDQCRQNLQRPHYRLALLCTCRQIHSEAALLLFALNTFLFGNHIGLFHFLRFVTPKQAKTIQKICTTISSVDDHDAEHPRISVHNQNVLKERLDGLQSLTILAILDREELEPAQRTRAKAAMVFRLLDLKAVTVAAFHIPSIFRIGMSKQDLNTWAGDLEAKLIKD